MPVASHPTRLEHIKRWKKTNRTIFFVDEKWNKFGYYLIYNFFIKYKKCTSAVYELGALEYF